MNEKDRGLAFLGVVAASMGPSESSRFRKESVESLDNQREWGGESGVARGWCSAEVDVGDVGVRERAESGIRHAKENLRVQVIYLVYEESSCTVYNLGAPSSHGQVVSFSNNVEVECRGLGVLAESFVRPAFARSLQTNTFHYRISPPQMTEWTA